MITVSGCINTARITHSICQHTGSFLVMDGSRVEELPDQVCEVWFRLEGEQKLIYKWDPLSPNSGGYRKGGLSPVMETQWGGVPAWESLDLHLSSKEKELRVPWDQVALSQLDTETCVCCLQQELQRIFFFLSYCLFF